jgi:hypothetical protein
MADFGFVGSAYEAPSIYQDAQECINFRPEIDPTKPQGSRGVVALYPTPGLTNVVTLQTAQSVRGMRAISGQDYLVAVCGPYVYVMGSDFAATIIGQLNTSTGQVGITDNGTNVYIVDGANRYTWRISNPNSAVFEGTISGTTLTVTRVLSGSIAANQALFGVGISNETVIVSGSGSSWTINQSHTITTDIRMNSAAVAAVITASMSATTLTVSAVSTGTLYIGQTIQGSGVTGKTIITALGSGTVLSETIATAGTGYAVNENITVLGGVYGSSPATYTVTTIGGSGAVTGLTRTFSGQYTSNPANNASTSSDGAGIGLTLTLTFGTGTGNTGNYVINNSQTVASRTMYALNFSELPATDGAFSGASSVDVVDNYFVYNRPHTQQYASSDLLSPITYGLAFASKFTGPDDLVSLIVDHGQIYLLGEKTSEVWADVGTFPFPFQRIPGASSQHGIAAEFSMARFGNSFVYVSRNDRGQAVIVQMNGYFPQRISTHAVENSLVNQNISDAVAYTYQLEGHECYVVSFPSLNLTWVYDGSSQMWHKWLWCDNENNYKRHRSNCSAFFQGSVLVGDWENGQIYRLDPNNYTDNGQHIRRMRRCPHLVTDFQRQYFDELQIQFQPGVGLQGIETFPLGDNDIGINPQAMLRWSNDGGSTWSNEHWAGIGKVGKYQNRIIWRRLGQARDRIYEVVVTDPVKAVIVSANLKASVGEN